MTQSGQETHDDKTTDDQKDNENYTFQNAGGGGAYNENDYATVNDHAHHTDDFTQVNGAITQQDTTYTDDDRGRPNALEAEQGVVARGRRTTQDTHTLAMEAGECYRWESGCYFKSQRRCLTGFGADVH